MPKPIVARLHKDLSASLQVPEVVKRLESLGIFPFLLPTPEAFGEYLHSEVAKYAKLVKETGIKADH